MLSVNSNSTNGMSFKGKVSAGRIFRENKLLGKLTKDMTKGTQKAPCKPQGKIIPKEIQYVDHSLLIGDKKDISLHIKKLEAYLKENPNNVEVRQQIVVLKNLIG